MADIILIPTYARPDYLRICLEHIAAAEGHQDKIIWICIDRGKALIREYYEVINDFRGALQIVTVTRPEHSYQGNSYNVLESYKEAYYSQARYIYLIEDDVFVTSDFFKWHEAVHCREPNILCSVAYRCSRNSEVDKRLDPVAYFKSHRDYASIGVCWKREALAPIIEHAHDDYYGNLVPYLLQKFPNNRFMECFAEQDGLIMRIMAVTNGCVAWPYVPRCYHFGVAGYNRPRGPRLSYQEIKEMINDQSKIEKYDLDFKDIETMPQNSIKWKAEDLHCTKVFN